MSPADKDALLAEIAESRRRLAKAGMELHSAGEGIRKKLDVPSRLAENFRKHRPAWVGGAALVGFLMTRLPARRKTVYVDEATGRKLGAAGKLGAAWAIAKFVAGAATPWIRDLAGAKIEAWMRQFSARKTADTPPTGNIPRE